ncbi:regulator of chromosome condensation (RCC1) family protein [Tasmannia lanceolata]|uniref:regulator of chromosome condensation (RCC1) family protein n=1 Tax=Tasmannia lanceolata TaxID=3420 RepID=UPI0040634604
MLAVKLPDSGTLSQKIIRIVTGEAHTLALTGEGSIYSWGRGTFGRLGTGKESDELFPVRIGFDLSKKVGLSEEICERTNPKFVGIAAGAYHSLALEDDGSVWSWGYNVYGQLGFSEGNSSVPCFIEQLLQLGSPDSVEESNPINKTPLKVSSVKAGGMMSLAIDSLGGLWMWGNCPPQSSTNDGEFSLVSSSVPLPVREFHGQTVIKVACGNEHVVALVSPGETLTGNNLVCYSWGNNNHGQLGLGDKESRLYPSIVETFNQECPWAVYEIACGAFHTAVLTSRKMGSETGSSNVSMKESEMKGFMCWTFGLGDNGQLGNGTTTSTCLPGPVNELPQDAFLISVDCGLFHTCVVSAAGDVWAWGMEKGLGLCPDASFSGTDSGDALSPLRILCNELHGPKFEDPVQVACGAAHTVLVANDGYKLWAWGRGRSGVLGGGSTTDSFVPCIAMWPPLADNFDEVTIGKEGKVKDNEFGKMMEKKLSLALEEMEVLRTKLALMERYASILHGSIFGKSFTERDLPAVLLNWGTFNIEKEWENMIESADRGKLTRIEAFYQNMLAGVKDKLMKRRIEEIVKECLHSLSTGSPVNMENAPSSQ